ncbi:uncharacterized protein LOC129217831 [Uloborus diversus]|uniref:uncharacterized protein LOC129217831 n=1 Tax=Uloborus diversus TaxID=327109 RepID=UPI00240A32C6|nr:uncharacterized protein LOC129217831 [Uloborus diversus]
MPPACERAVRLSKSAEILSVSAAASGGWQNELCLGSCLGTAALGFIVVKNSMQCLIAKQYLLQASTLLMGASLLAFISLRDYSGYVLFVCIYGFFYGGYQYSLKTFTFEKVRARNFARAWSFVQCSQAIPMIIGLPLTGYLNANSGGRVGFYFASACICAGGVLLFLIDVHKRNVKRQKSATLNSNYDPTESERKERKAAYYARRVSLQELANARMLAKQHIANELLHKQELTCISEEAIMENFLDDYVDDCITSCNKEEKYLMLSEFENNLINTQESSSVSQEVRKLAKERKVSTVTPPCLEQCPNCFRVVAIDGSTSLEKTHVSRSSAKKLTASRRKDNKTSDCHEILNQVTSTL